MFTMLTEAHAKRLLLLLTYELSLQEGNVGVQVDSLVAGADSHFGSQQD